MYILLNWQKNYRWIVQKIDWRRQLLRLFIYQKLCVDREREPFRTSIAATKNSKRLGKTEAYLF